MVGNNVKILPFVSDNKYITIKLTVKFSYYTIKLEEISFLEMYTLFFLINLGCVKHLHPFHKGKICEMSDSMPIYSNFL